MPRANGCSTSKRMYFSVEMSLNDVGLVEQPKLIVRATCMLRVDNDMEFGIC